MRKAELVEIEKREEKLVDLLTPFFRCEVPFSYTVEERCMERGLLPAHLLDCLGVLNFLSFAVLSAQRAQRKFGVRASVLLSIALYEFGHDIRDLARDPMLCSDRGDNRRRISPNIDRWFLARARRLATAKALRKALPCISPRRYIYQLCDFGFCDSLKADDLWSNIEEYHLDDCDLCGMLPIGEYLNGEFDKVTDRAGRVLGLQPSPYRDLLRKGSGAEVAP